MDHEFENTINTLVRGTDNLKSIIVLPVNAIIIILLSAASIAIIGLIALGLSLVVVFFTMIMLLTILANIILLPFKLIGKLFRAKNNTNYIDAELVK